MSPPLSAGPAHRPNLFIAVATVWACSLVAQPILLDAVPGDSGENGTAGPPALPWNVAYDVELCTEEGYTQRAITDLGASRAVWWAKGDIVLTREEPAPAGMVEREYYLHNPLEETEHRLGVSAGPVVFGPVRILGGYRRALDPSGGGVVPAAVTDLSTIELDTAREPSSWDGAAVSPGVLHAPAGGLGANAGVAYLFNRDRAHILLGRIGLAPSAARWGHLSVVGISAERLHAGRSVTMDARDESWVRDVPAPQTAVIRGGSVSYRMKRGGWNDEHDAPIPIFLLLEGHRQGYSWRPRRHAGQIVLRVGSPRLRTAVRGVAVETGFVDADLTPPTRAAYRGVRMEGAERLPTRREENRPFLAWTGDFESQRKWEDALPGKPSRTQRYAFAFHSGGVLRRGRVELKRPDEECTVAATIGTPARWDGSVIARFAGEYRWNNHTPERRIALETSVRRRGRSGTGARGRRIEVRWRVVGEKTGESGADAGIMWDHSVVVAVPLGVASDLTFRLAVEDAATDNAEYSGALQFHWSTGGSLIPNSTPRPDITETGNSTDRE